METEKKRREERERRDCLKEGEEAHPERLDSNDVHSEHYRPTADEKELLIPVQDPTRVRLRCVGYYSMLLF